MRTPLSLLLSFILSSAPALPAAAQVATVPVEVSGVVAAPVPGSAFAPLSQAGPAQSPALTLGVLSTLTLKSLDTVAGTALIAGSGVAARLSPAASGASLPSASVPARSSSPRTTLTAARAAALQGSHPSAGLSPAAPSAVLQETGSTLAADVSGDKAPAALASLFGESRRAASVDAPAVLLRPQGRVESRAQGRLSPWTRPVSSRGLNLDAEDEFFKGGEQAPQNGPAQSEAPRSSLKRSLQVGMVGMIAGFLLETAFITVPMFFGHHAHPSYGHNMPMLHHPTILQGLQFTLSATVMAPIAEEMIFRLMVFAGAQKVFARFHKESSFLLAAGLSSLFFVLLHETSDPFFIMGRMAQALIMTYVFQKEGLAASMSLHAFANAMGTIPFFLGLLFGPQGAILGTLLTLVGGMRLFRHSLSKLKEQAPDVEAGKITPYRIPAKGGLLMAAVLVLGIAFVSPTLKACLLWGGAAVGWLVYSYVTARRRERGEVSPSS